MMTTRQIEKQHAWAAKRRAEIAGKRADLDAKRTRQPLTDVLAAAVGAYRLDPFGIHGPQHWLRVLRNGRELARHTPGADLAVIEHFALLHDCQRLDDNADPYHGERAGAFVRTLDLALSDLQRESLIAACDRHEHGDVSDDPTIGCCFDADRLELSRLRIRPESAFLSTAAAEMHHVQSGAWLRGIRHSVESL